MISCAVCEADIDVEEDELDEGDTVTCDECGADMRVVSVDPLELESLDEDDDEDDLDFEEDDDEEEEEDEEEFHK
jgi:alpha-aminoadipate/glutamate carrier protein LysW